MRRSPCPFEVGRLMNNNTVELTPAAIPPGQSAIAHRLTRPRREGISAGRGVRTLSPAEDWREGRPESSILSETVHIMHDIFLETTYVERLTRAAGAAIIWKAQPSGLGEATGYDGQVPTGGIAREHVASPHARSGEIPEPTV